MLDDDYNVLPEDDIEAGEEERRQQSWKQPPLPRTPTLEQQAKGPDLVMNDAEVLRVRPKLRKSAGTPEFGSSTSESSTFNPSWKEVATRRNL
jgi:hypothetical protein